MQGYFPPVSFALLVCLAAGRSLQLKRLGIKAFRLGEKDKRDYVIIPFVLAYVYLIAANAFHLPGKGGLFNSAAALDTAAAWTGAALCVLAPIVFLWGLVSFGRSFRVGIDDDTPGGLITTGAFAHSRNPLYVAFFMFFTGVFLVFPCWVFFAYFLAALWLIDRQVCLEENALKNIYGVQYDAYCEKVRRYL